MWGLKGEGRGFVFFKTGSMHNKLPNIFDWFGHLTVIQTAVYYDRRLLMCVLYAWAHVLKKTIEFQWCKLDTGVPVVDKKKKILLLGGFYINPRPVVYVSRVKLTKKSKN